jgi:ribose transport system substrate-binding protein
MQTQLSLRIVVVLAALGLFVGCDTKSSTPQGKSPDKPQVALVMKSLANEFFKTMEDGAKAHQKAHAAEYDLIANGIPDEQDVAKQSDLVEQMIAKKVHAIVIAPTDSKAMVPVCKKALDAGIVVINIDNKLDEAALKEKGITVPFVGPDNRMGARLAGDCLAKKLQKGDQVAIIEGLRGAFNAEQRRLGFEDAMKAAGATIATSQSARWETEPAVAIVGPILLAQPQLKAILCANDSMALGAISALRGANKLGQIQVVGFDNIKAVQQLIKDGKMLCTIDQHADQIAAYGIEYAIQILQKKATPADKQTPVDLITAETLK